MIHRPVLLNEIIEHLDPQPNENFIDATFGMGGLGLAILERTSPNGKLIGIDADPELSQFIQEISAEIQAREKEERFVLINDSFIHIRTIVSRLKIRPIHGIVFDLGLSSWHLEKSKRGFSFLKEPEELDMRFNPEELALRAKDILNQWSRQDLARIFREYGEERFAERIAKAIFETRRKKRISTVGSLLEIITRAIPQRFWNSRRHPATKIFQALRIAVNNELENLHAVLPLAFDVLSPDGRLAVISFHSLEDKIVKQFFLKQKRARYAAILTKKPILPKREEIKLNPRSRSAKLRVLRKLS